MRMISRDVTRPVLLLIVLCWGAAGSMGPNRDEKTEKCLQELDCPDEPQNPQLAEPPVELGSVNNQADKRALTRLIRPAFMKAGPMVSFFNKFSYKFRTQENLKLVEKEKLASIYNEDYKHPAAAFALFEFSKGKKGITQKEFPNKFHQEKELEKCIQARKAWFLNSGFDCGHMLPRQFLKYDSVDLLYETCSFAFVIPQAREFNQGNWKRAENKAKAIMEELTPEGGKQTVLIMSFTSDKVISFNDEEEQFVYTSQEMNPLQGKTGKVLIPNSIGQVVFFPIFNDEGNLEKVKYVAYIGNNSDSVVLTAFVLLEEFGKWNGINIVEGHPDITFEQVVVDQLDHVTQSKAKQ